MIQNETTYKERKVITIGIVSELTGLSERQIRYYESRKLIFPERSKRGIRKYSFQDIELLIEIANKLSNGIWTHEIKKDFQNRQLQKNKNNENLPFPKDYPHEYEQV